jgi:hypothetical protein
MIEMQKCASHGWFLTTCPGCGTTGMSDTHHFTAEELHRSFEGDCSTMTALKKLSSKDVPPSPIVVE